MATKNPTTKPAIRTELRPDGVAVLLLDVPGQSQNTLKTDLIDKFAEVLDWLESDRSIRAAVFASGKPDSFLAGADLSSLEHTISATAAEALSRRGQEAMNRLEELRLPIVAAIHGACLGGGLELALVCAARVCSDSPKTVFGLPEVQLGLLPGAGGTQRLPRLVGIQTALDLMLTGRHVRPAKAKKMGLVDEVVRASILIDVAAKHALRLLQEPGAKKATFGAALKDFTSAKGAQRLALEENPLGRKLLFQQARKALLAKTRHNYPAAERIVDVVELGIEKGLERGLEEEAKAFGALTVSNEAKQLMNIFFAMNALKKDTGVEGAAETVAVSKLGILGAGLMGAGIATVTLDKAYGVSVRLKDRDDEGLGRGLSHIKKFFDKRVKKRVLTANQGARQRSRVTATTDLTGFGGCEVVIEAVFEDLDLKHRLLKELEGAGHKPQIFATNTSSIPITRIAEVAEHPERVIGMHYFSPVEKMPLLEIIVTEKTADWVTATCVELGKAQGKTVIVVRDGVGFYTSRILGPYMNEAARILMEGVAIEKIDRALMDWGYPVGPITLLDEVGLDVAAKVGPIMIEAFGARFEPPAVMKKLLADDRKGRKNGRGFYTYEEKKKKPDKAVYALLGVKPKTKADPVELAERCAYLMLNEAAYCLDEGILRSPRDGDIGAIFGLGFPPFRGGPFRMVDQVGAAEVVRKLQALQGRFGDRFAPAPNLVRMASTSATFY